MQTLSSTLGFLDLDPGGTGFVILIVAIGCSTGLGFALIATISNIAKTKAREATKREIAAYVAEGTIDPEKAIALIEAGKSTDAQEIAAAIHGHTPRDAAKVIHA